MNKKQMSEQDIRSKFITPAIVEGGWDLHTQIREEVTFTQGKVIVKGKLGRRGKAKRAESKSQTNCNRLMEAVVAEILAA
jgi:type I restriction enzyme R subunit